MTAAQLGATASAWMATIIHAWSRDSDADRAALARARQVVGNVFANLRTAVRLLKGRYAMNLVQIIPLVITDITAVTKLTKDYQADDKASAEADMAAVIPTVALITGKTEAEIASVLTPELAGTVFDLAEAAPSLVKAIEAALAARTTHAEQPAA